MKLTPCLNDSLGQRVTKWLPHMQSTDFLRQSIAAGVRTAECWAEITRRNKRWQVAERILQRLTS